MKTSKYKMLIIIVIIIFVHSIFIFAQDNNIIVLKKLIDLPHYRESSISSFQVDLRCCDLTKLDLRNNSFDLFHSIFDNYCIWPKDMPNDFEPKEILENNKNLGLHIKEVQRMGFTGKGVTVALIDTPLRITHEEYKKSIKYYETVGFNDNEKKELYYHGPVMASVLVGSTIGVAPESNLYYFATRNTYNNGKYTAKYEIETLNRIIDFNKKLANKEKIRAISTSLGNDPDKYLDINEYYEYETTVKNVINNGIMVISWNLFEQNPKYMVYGLRRDPYVDPDNIENYKPIPWNEWIIKINNFQYSVNKYIQLLSTKKDWDVILIPLDPMTTADMFGDDNYSYKFVRGWSETAPYITGLYAIACQIDSNITFDDFWNVITLTGTPYNFIENNINFHGKIIDPIKMITEISKIKNNQKMGR